LDEARKVVAARGKSLTDKHDRHQRGGYANQKSRYPFKRPADTKYPGKDLAFNRVQFTNSPPSDSDPDSFSSQGVATDDGGEMNSRPAKSPKLAPNSSRNPAGGRGGGGRRATQPAHNGKLGGSPRPQVLSLQGADRTFGKGSISRGAGRGGRGGYGQGAGRGRSQPSGPRTPDFSGQDPQNAMHMNKSVSVGQTIWLQNGARCFFCFRYMRTCVRSLNADGRCRTRDLPNWPALNETTCPDWALDGNGPIPIWE